MLVIADPDHFASVCKFAAQIGLAGQLAGKLAYLDQYAYDPDGQEFQRRIEKKCVLGKDFAPHSFSFAIYQRDLKVENLGDAPTWKFWFNGGLIYQGPDCPADGSFPSLTVSLAKGTGWFVHT
jgi:hypothetical protein